MSLDGAEDGADVDGVTFCCEGWPGTSCDGPADEVKCGGTCGDAIASSKEGGG